MKVAVAGLGQMGSAIAERLLDAGHTVAVHNRTPGRAGDLVARGAQEVDARGAVWDAADVCVTMVSDSAALLDLALGEDGLATSASGRGKTLIDMSTVSVDASAEVAAAAADAGIAYLRAPVSGNPVVVRAGKLGIVASGPPETFAECEALLHDIGPNVFHIGAAEEARVMKLALNLMIAGTAELLAESIAFGEAHGLGRAAMLDVIKGSAVGSPFVTVKAGPLVEDDYTSTFTTRLMRKDLDMALEAAGRERVPLPVTALIQQLLEECIDAGMGDDDFTALLPRLQQAGARA